MFSNSSNSEQQPVPESTARLKEVSLRYGKTYALDAVTVDLPAGCMVGLIGPDGVGKSSILSLVAGARQLQQGQVHVLGGDMRDAEHRRNVCPRIAYMPQGLGKNLYPTLSVFENVDFFGRLFGHNRKERERRITDLLKSTDLARFADRPAGKLSGGMKQKLSLCCSLIHDPDLLILDEPTTGVDPLSRRQFWELVGRISSERSGMSILVATAYMDEAAQFDHLVAMDEGKVIAEGTPSALLERTGKSNLEEAFIALLPEEKKRNHRIVQIPARGEDSPTEVAIEACDLTKRFGDFTAVDKVNFRIERGEIFGFLGSNGCGKSTTMKVLTGLLPATEGSASLLGEAIDADSLETRRRIGYMSQAFSLYSELTVRQNLVLHARLFKVPDERIEERVTALLERFGLVECEHILPDSLPLGIRQRLSLAVALVHQPELLILDEPTSGVDPIARDAFWQELVTLSRKDHVTIFISTHFLNEAARCDRISLMHAGQVLVSDTPAGLIEKRGASTLEEAFIGYLEDAFYAKEKETFIEPGDPLRTTNEQARENSTPADASSHGKGLSRYVSAPRILSYAMRESLELRRDPIRLVMALLGNVILMIIMGYGITMDVQDLSFAVLDRDQTGLSANYALNIQGSRYFTERPPLVDYADIDRRMRAGEVSLAIEIPPGFAQRVERGVEAEVGVWIDGSMPERAETIRGYIRGIHDLWLSQLSATATNPESIQPPATIETRFRYNPDIKSLVAMVPGVIPLLLMLVPSMLAALSVVREKELGSIVNLYVTPVTRLEFIVGKQAPYLALGLINFVSLMLLAWLLFDVPFTGSFLAICVGAVLYVGCATGLGLLISAFTKSQVAAIFGTAIVTLLPATQFCGLTDPVSSLRGAGAFIGSIYPTSYFLNISRGAFSKALSFSELWPSMIPLLIALPVLVGAATILVRKQEA